MYTVVVFGIISQGPSLISLNTVIFIKYTVAMIIQLVGLYL